jgi:hypothetical protein
VGDRDSPVGILATGWTVRGSNPGGGEIFRTRPDRPWDPPSLLYNGYRVFPGVKRIGRGADHPPPSSAKVRKEWSSPPPMGLRVCYGVPLPFTLDLVPSVWVSVSHVYVHNYFNGDIGDIFTANVIGIPGMDTNS